jgi:hypothetical protein
MQSNERRFSTVCRATFKLKAGATMNLLSKGRAMGKVEKRRVNV